MDSKDYEKIAKDYAAQEEQLAEEALERLAQKEAVSVIMDGGGKRFNKGKARVDLLPFTFHNMVCCSSYNVNCTSGTYVAYLKLVMYMYRVTDDLPLYMCNSNNWNSLGEDIAKVLEAGMEKYGERNWERGMPWSMVFPSALRHIRAVLRGEKIDEETGLPHSNLFNCNVMFLREYALTCPSLDDRPIYRVEKAEEDEDEDED